ncbi:hypothetical protein [Rhodopila globiformis]|uniref:hypothetical protein n=1 Tax=Rhodopila globiformis TaxID=1071 RepID=UPI0011B0B62A|nr:hypothetical protein [Rhodopila globiformis]
MIVATSMACCSPSAPVFTNLTIQATRSPPIRDQTRNYRFDARTPNLQAVPGAAYFTLADHARPDIKPRLRAELGSDGTLAWGSCHHPGMIDIAAILASPLPWNDGTAGQQTAGLRRIGNAWWDCFAPLADVP